MCVRFEDGQDVTQAQDDAVLSTSQVAEALNVNVQTVRRYCRNNDLETVNTSCGNGRGTRYGVPISSLLGFIRAHRPLPRPKRKRP